jgi:hypothetical protein
VSSLGVEEFEFHSKFGELGFSAHTVAAPIGAIHGDHGFIIEFYSLIQCEFFEQFGCRELYFTNLFKCFICFGGINIVTWVTWVFNLGSTPS